MSTVNDLYSAVRSGNVQRLRNGLTQGPRPTRRELHELLGLSVSRLDLVAANSPQRENIINSLLKYGAPTDLNTQTMQSNDYPFRFTPLGFAIRDRKAAIVKLLLDHGANPNQRDIDGYTALHRAAMIPDNAATIRLLIQRGANVDLKTSNNVTSGFGAFGGGLTPLHLAIQTSGGIENVRTLVDVGKAKVNAKSSTGSSSLHMAVYKIGKEKEQVIRFLLDRGVHVNTKDNVRGWTPLHTASHMGHYYPKGGYRNIIKILLEHGAIPFIQNFQGRTPADLASNKKINNMLRTWPGERSALRRMAMASMNSVRNRNTGNRLHVPENVKQRILSKTGLFRRNQYGRPINGNNAEIRNAWTKEQQRRKRKRNNNS
jgi:ankyrin repeat protein